MKNTLLLLVVLGFGVLSLSACGGDDEVSDKAKKPVGTDSNIPGADPNVPKDGADPNAPRAGFTFQIDENDPFTVRFSNTSRNAIRYLWDFGNGETSTEEDPKVKKYLKETRYKIKLTAYGSKDEGKPDDTFEATVTINKLLRLLTGSPNGVTAGSKKWILRRVGGLALTYKINTFRYPLLKFGYGEFTSAHEIKCILDDEYTFEIVDAGGIPAMRFIADTKNTFYIDNEAGRWQKRRIDSKCQTEPMNSNDATNVFWQIDRRGYTNTNGKLIYPNSNPGSRTGQDFIPDIYEYRNKSGDADKGGYTFTLNADQLTLNGRGSYIGLQAESNTGNKGYLVPEMRTFRISHLAKFDWGSGGTGTEMTLQMFVGNDGDSKPYGVWTFHLEHYDDDSKMPAVPSAPVSNFDFESFCPNFFNPPGSNSVCIRNPAKDGINTSEFVAHLQDNGSDPKASTYFFTEPVVPDLSEHCGLKMKVYGRSGLEVLLKLEHRYADRFFYGIKKTVSSANTWETLSFDFSPFIAAKRGTGYYDKFVFSLDEGNAAKEMLYIDDIEVDTSIAPCSVSSSTVLSKIDFEDASCPISSDNIRGGIGSCVNNPDPDGINTSNKVAKLYDEGTLDSAIITFHPPKKNKLDFDLDLRTNCGFKMKVYGRSGAKIYFHLSRYEDGGDAHDVITEQTVASANTWETLKFDFSGLITASKRTHYNRFTFYMSLGGVTMEETLYIDDLEMDTSVGTCNAP